MKKLFSIALFAVMVLGWGTSFAQCTINTSNTTTGFTPDPPSAITQGVVYAQTVQVYVPPTYPYTLAGVGTVTVDIDSIHIDSMTALPTGIVYVFNPHDGDGGTVITNTPTSGGNGAICFSGTTTDTVGTYTVAFHGTAYVTVPGLGPQTATLASLASAFHYAFTVQAPAVAGCDTIFNVANSDQPGYSVWQSPSSGYVSGNGTLSAGGQSLAITQVAERFETTSGFHVNTAVIYPAYTTINPSDSGLPVTIYVYDTTGVPLKGLAGAPGNPLDSAIVTLGELSQIATINNTSNFIPAAVNFPHQPALNGSGFYIVIGLPQKTGDTLVIFTNSGSTPYGNGWLGTDAGWLGYDSILGGITNLGLFVGVVACPTQGLPPIAAFTPSATTGCAPASITFTDNSTQGATSYQWSFGDGSTSTTKNPSHTYSSAGTYSVLEYAVNGNGATEAVSTITVDAVTATVGTAPGAAGVTVTTGVSPYTYLWSTGATTASITQEPVAAYTVTITDNSGCTDTLTANITIGVGIIELSSGEQVKIYPNPATDVLNLVWSQKSNAEVSIVDLNGNVISTITTAGDMKTVCDVHNLAAGNYIVRITDKTNNQQQSQLFTKF